MLGTNRCRGMKHRAHVIVFQRYLTHYRTSFFEQAAIQLGRADIHLSLVHGHPDAVSETKKDSASIPGTDMVAARSIKVSGIQGVWLPTPRHLPAPDLVVLPQESKLLANYYWLCRRLLGGPKVAFWGHGVNFQSDSPLGWKERWKRMMLGRVDWWFAYTERTRNVLIAEGYPNQRITVLNNAIDTTRFRADLEAVTTRQLAELRAKVGAVDTAPVGLFCGSLYPDKRLDFLVAAAERIRTMLPDFQLIVIGDGPDREQVLELIVDKPWIHATGALYGSDKATWFRLAGVVLNPGLVGLNVLDAFCAGLPLVTTREARHSPEIAYLENGINGSIVSGEIPEYATAVVDLLKDPASYDAMCRNALAGASRYTQDNMVQQFCGGIEQCLATPRTR